MILNLESQIQKAKDVEDVKILLSQILAGLNQLAESKNKIRGDLVFLDDDAGLVMRLSGKADNVGSGEFVRLRPTGLTTLSIELDPLGKSLGR